MHVHCELTGTRSEVIVLPPTIKFRLATCACDRLWSPAPCVTTSSSPVESAPPNKLPDANDLVIKPPVAGSEPVSLSVAFIPARVALTDVARPLKVAALPGVGVGFGGGTIPHRTRILAA